MENITNKCEVCGWKALSGKRICVKCFKEKGYKICFKCNKIVNGICYCDKKQKPVIVEKHEQNVLKPISRILVGVSQEKRKIRSLRDTNPELYKRNVRDCKKYEKETGIFPTWIIRIMNGKI